MKREVLASSLALLLSLAALPARADVLVTVDGARVETRGPWKVDGRRVLFTQPNGTLSSLRTSQVDLEASRRATEAPPPAAAARAAAAKPEPAEPVWRITEKDIPPMSEAAMDAAEADSDAAESGGGAAAAAENEAEPAVPLTVVSWDQAPTPAADGLMIYGTLRNEGRENVVAPGITVAVYGDDGGLLATADGTVNQSAMAPGRTANFRIELPGLLNFASAKFIPSGRGYQVQRPATSIEGAGEAADEGQAAEPEASSTDADEATTDVEAFGDEEAPPPHG